MCTRIQQGQIAKDILHCAHLHSKFSKVRMILDTHYMQPHTHYIVRISIL